MNGSVRKPNFLGIGATKAGTSSRPTRRAPCAASSPSSASTRGFAPDVSKVVNPGGLQRSRLLYLVLSSRTARRVGRHIVPMPIQNRLERLNDNLQAQRLGPDERREAVALFRDDILRTQDLVGRDLSGRVHA